MSESPEEMPIAKEVAEAEFSRFADLMDLDLDPTGWDADDKKTFEDSKAKFIRAVRRGNLTVDEKGQPTYTPQLEPRTPIVFYEPDGAAVMAMDYAKKNHLAEQGFKMLAAMTKTPEKTFALMKNRDLKVCQAVQLLFLASA